MTAYWTDDQPGPLRLIPSFRGELVDLGEFTAATIALRDPSGTTIEEAGTVTLDEETGEAVVTWAHPLFTEPGYWTAQLTLTADGIRLRADMFAIIVETDDGWYTLGQARAEWPDAPAGDDAADAALYRLLTIAKRDVLAYYAKELDGRPPAELVEAQRAESRELLNIGIVDSAANQVGEGEFVLARSSWTMSPEIRRLIRPATGVPVVA